MKIKIENTDKFYTKLTEELKKIEGKSTVRTLGSNTVLEIINSVEKRLSIPKNAMVGIKVKYTGAEKFPNAYKYTPMSTHFTAERTSGGWYITELKRATCPNRNNNTNIILTEIAKKAIIENIETFRG